MQVFNLISQQNMSPNQFYLLYSIREGISTIGINLHQDLRGLVSEGFVMDKDADDIKIIITDKGHAILAEVESYFKVKSKKTASAVMGTGFTEKLIQYNELFPKMKLPSGKLARASERNLETNFKWFFENNKYSWEIILKATAIYVDEYERKNWLYMRNALYFIKKSEKDHSITSDLADYCAMIEAGGQIEPVNHFKDKVI